jgi:hypothetical protein
MGLDNAAGKVRVAEKKPEKHTSGAKARTFIYDIYGTTEVVPFQDIVLYKDPRIMELRQRPGPKGLHRTAAFRGLKAPAPSVGARWESHWHGSRSNEAHASE